MAKLSQVEFLSGFVPMLERVAQAEKVTKAELKVWCNNIVDAMHTYGQIDYMNKLIAVLTPVNKKVVIEFFKTFAGYKMGENGLFESKDKKRYFEALKNWNESTQDPTFNVWTWAERNIEVTVKPFTTEDISKRMATIWKMAHEQNISNADILRAALTAKSKDGAMVFKLEDVISCLTELGVEGDLAVDPTSEFVIGEKPQVEDAPL